MSQLYGLTIDADANDLNAPPAIEFEGTFEQVIAAMVDAIIGLADDTVVFSPIGEMRWTVTAETLVDPSLVTIAKIED